LNIIQFVQKYIETPAHDLSSTQSVLEIWQHLQLHTQSDLSSSNQNHIDIIWNNLKDPPPSYLPKVYHAFVFFIHQYDADLQNTFKTIIADHPQYQWAKSTTPLRSLYRASVAVTALHKKFGQGILDYFKNAYTIFSRSPDFTSQLLAFLDLVLTKNVLVLDNLEYLGNL